MRSKSSNFLYLSGFCFSDRCKWDETTCMIKFSICDIMFSRKMRNLQPKFTWSLFCKANTAGWCSVWHSSVVLFWSTSHTPLSVSSQSELDSKENPGRRHRIWVRPHPMKSSWYTAVTSVTWSKIWQKITLKEKLK